MKIATSLTYATATLALFIGGLEASISRSFQEGFLPKGLVLKPSQLQYHAGKSFTPTRDQDFHIVQHDPNTAIVWVSASQGLREQYLCGAIYALDQEHPNVQSIVDCKSKMVTTWSTSPFNGDFASTMPHRQIDWELVDEEQPQEKWIIAGVHKKQNAPVSYMIKKGDDSRWITKEQALELSLEGQLEVVIP